MGILRYWKIGQLRMRWVVIGGLALVCLFWFGFNTPSPTHAENERVITIYHDGQEQTMVTDATTVAEALQRGNINLYNHDAVEPSRDTELIAPSYNINVYRARPVTVVDGNQRYQIMSAHSSARQIAADAGLKLYDEDAYDLTRIDNFVAEDSLGLKLTIHRSVSIKFLLYGKEIQMRTLAATVSDFIKEKQLVLQVDDKLWPTADTQISPNGMTIALYAVGTMDITEEPVPFAVKKIQDADQPVGYQQIQTPGQPGRRFVIYKIEAGVRTELQSYVLVPPKEQVEVVGTKGPVFGGDLAAALAALRNCEARANQYATNTGNGFYGAYQFTASTWSAHAPDGWKDLLPVAPTVPGSIQDAAAVHLYNARGWQPWPTCSLKLGLQDIYR